MATSDRPNRIVYLGGIAMLMSQPYVDVILDGDRMERWLPRDAGLSLMAQWGYSREEATEVVSMLEMALDLRPEGNSNFYYMEYDLDAHRVRLVQ